MHSLETLKRLNEEAEAEATSKTERVRVVINQVLQEYFKGWDWITRVDLEYLKDDLLQAVLKVK